MPTLDDIPTPALVVDLDRLEQNVARMAERADKLGVALRPHVKTHKCVEIGRIQEAAGSQGITVATLHEAEVFATAGFHDILWAFPVIPSRLRQAVELSQRVKLGLVADSAEAVELLSSAETPLRIWLKVDCGYHRCGIDPATDAIVELAGRVRDAGMRLAGILSHSGDAYAVQGRAARAAVCEAERACMAAVAERLRDAGHEVPNVSVGSTPTMTAADDLEGVTEARPGNYAFFDRSQLALGSCTLEECALTVVSTVVSCGREHSILDAGALALSVDRGPDDGVMAAVCSDMDGHAIREDVAVVGLSQEHGKLSSRLPWGTRLRLLPNHSCLTAACFTQLHAVRGREVVSRWRVWNGR